MGALPQIYTIGHSNRPIGEFIELLKAHGVAQVVDVRTVPKSRHNPQFNSDALAQALAQAEIRYARIEALGGFRKARTDSANLGWRNLSFRGYADYLATPEFARGLAELIALAAERRSAIMCAEAVPWRCHRSLIADALTVQGFEVLDIMSAERATPHRLTPFLKVIDGTLTYPPEGPQTPQML